MTHPLTNALAMRTAAAEATRVPKFCIEAEKDRVEALHAYRAAILALPLEADRDALLREAVTLPEVAALIEAVKDLGLRKLVAGWNGEDRDKPYASHPPFLAVTIRTNAGDVYAIDAALQPFLALETP